MFYAYYGGYEVAIGLIFEIQHEVSSCTPVMEIFSSSTAAVCDQTVDPMVRRFLVLIRHSLELHVIFNEVFRPYLLRVQTLFRRDD